MKIGFTGTRLGFNDHQKWWFDLVFENFNEYLYFADKKFTEFIHGDAIGADSQFHSYCVKHHSACPISIYPSDLEEQRAYSNTGNIVYIHEPLSPLKRNDLIIQEADFLIACPESDTPRPSGTWSTIRKAMIKGIDVFCISYDLQFPILQKNTMFKKYQELLKIV